ncbi:hypothetical protein LRS73_17420 [Methylobacterium currus]|uniref:glycoside hydrolase family protein n=1 Tax=Methylobacterium currus TaxID=2051553 RepID=UPI001E357920|nr:hypothetical protein [Methylobacterium currus]UHC14340.1 hypothetical protein LRS73_17420 [Methylobacterium currus]
MADDIQVRFGGDASGIRAAAAQAQQAAQGFATSARASSTQAQQGYAALAAELRLTREAMQAQAAAALQAATATQRIAAASREAGDWQTDLKAKLEETTAGYVAVKVAALDAYAAQALWSSAVATVTDPFRNFRAIADTIRATYDATVSAATAARDWAASYAYVSRYAQIADVDARSLIGGIARYAVEMQRSAAASAVMATGVSDLAGRTIAAAGAMDTFRQAAATAGASTVTEYLNRLIVEIARVPGVTAEAAAGIVGLFGSIEGLSNTALEAMVSSTRMLSASAEEARKDAEGLAAAMRDPAASGEAYLKNMLGASAARKDDFAAARQTLDVNQMLAVILQARADKLREVGKEMKRTADEQTAAYNAMNALQQGLNENLRQQGKEALRFTVELEKQAQKLEQQAASLKSMALSADQLRDAVNGLTAGGLEGRLATSQGRQGILQQGIGSTTGDAAALIKQFEGFSPYAKRDSDGAFRTGYGSDTVTDAAGRVSHVTPSTTTTIEDAERDLQRRLSDEFVPRVASQLGDAFGKLSDQARASLTSIAYNYGSLPSSVVTAAKAAPGEGTERGLADAIRRLPANPERRQAEADNIPAERLTALNAERDAAQALRNELAGGSAEQKAAAENARLAAAGMGDEVAAAQRVLAAARETAASASSKRAQEEASLRVSQAESALRQTEEARLRAQVALKTVGSDNTDADAAKARIAMIDQLLAKEQDRSTRSLALEREKKDIELAMERAAAAEAEAIETAAFTRQRQALQERLADIKAEARDRALSYQERLALTQQVNAELEALELGHNDRLQKIREDDKAKLRQLAQERIQIEGQASTRRQRAVIDANHAEVQETRRTYEQIGATLTGNTFAVLQGQQTVAQAARATAMSIIRSYVQAKVRLAADWLAGVTTHQAGEAAKTAATVAGVTARTGAEEAGAATSLATQGGAMIKSIMASAAETFAGIFGFLSPLMGPAAAGPALAGEATVAAAAAAIPSFAVGAWALPGDTLANVHRGEMIVPAAATPWAQSLMAQAAGGKAGSAPASTGDVHFHVSAVDAAGVKAFFRANARHIMEAINDGVRTGSHLGLSKLRT